MWKLSTILEIIFWTALGVVILAFYIPHAYSLSIAPLLHAIVYWFKFGVWEVETLASANIIRETSWIGLNKILFFFGGIPTWLVFSIVYGFFGLFIYGFTFGKAAESYRELKEKDKDHQEDKE